MKAADPDYWRKYRAERWPADRQYLYGLSPEQFDDLLGAQSGDCYLCRTPLDLEARRGVHVDHDHDCCSGRRSCGECVRGLACDRCNTGIGKFSDDPELLRLVADNLQAAIECLAR